MLQNIHMFNDFFAAKSQYRGVSSHPLTTTQPWWPSIIFFRENFFPRSFFSEHSFIFCEQVFVTRIITSSLLTSWALLSILNKPHSPITPGAIVPPTNAFVPPWIYPPQRPRDLPGNAACILISKRRASKCIMSFCGSIFPPPFCLLVLNRSIVLR